MADTTPALTGSGGTPTTTTPTRRLPSGIVRTSARSFDNFVKGAIILLVVVVIAVLGFFSIQHAGNTGGIEGPSWGFWDRVFGSRNPDGPSPPGQTGTTDETPVSTVDTPGQTASQSDFCNGRVQYADFTTGGEVQVVNEQECAFVFEVVSGEAHFEDRKGRLVGKWQAGQPLPTFTMQGKVVQIRLRTADTEVKYVLCQAGKAPQPGFWECLS